MIEIKDLEAALLENEKRLLDIEAENRVFHKLIEIEKSKENACAEVSPGENVENV